MQEKTLMARGHTSKQGMGTHLPSRAGALGSEECPQLKESFLTLQQPATGELVIKKSRFIAFATPVGSADEALNIIQEIRQRHSQANHNVFAFAIDEITRRFSDDGEPGGTAGKPVLEVITQKGLQNTLVVVTRYFGGIMLGAGGLVRAYRDAAIQGIEKAGIVKKTLYRQLNITADYTHLGLIKRELEKAGGQNIGIVYDAKINIKVLLPPDAAKLLTKGLVDATAAQIAIQPGSFIYV